MAPPHPPSDLKAQAMKLHILTVAAILAIAILAFGTLQPVRDWVKP
jgi:hypothetical protein